MSERCSVTVGSGFRVSKCARNAVVEVGGKHYCKQHDPAAVAARRAESERAYSEKRDRENRNTVILGLRWATVEQLRAELLRREMVEPPAKGGGVR